MKKLILLAVILISVSSFSYAIEVNQKVLTSFKKDFNTAVNVQWKSFDADGLYEAMFTYNREQVIAYYNEEGELVNTARYICKANLPILVSKQIEEKYADYLYRTVIECNNNKEITYLITLVGTQKSLIISASPAGNLNVLKKFKTY